MNAASASRVSGTPPHANTPGDTTKEHLQHSFATAKELDVACAAFELALARGERPNIDAIVESASESLRTRLFRELLAIEMEFRAGRGETPSLNEYRQRFSTQLQLVKFLYLERFTPAVIGDFPVQRLVGRGGFGHVYQAWDQKLSRTVAIKVFRRDPDRPGPPGSLLVEARSAAQLRHPGVVTVHAILPDSDGDEFLVLEYVDGCSLEELLRSSQLSSREAASLILAVVQALQHAHQHGLVHRDLKPANILLEQGCRPRVTDFGLALQLTEVRRSPLITGTLSYMSPEQANGESHRLDSRTDVWAVGVVLYRMLTGKLPFSAPDYRALLNSIQYDEPVDPLLINGEIAPELARVTMRCLSKRMSDRYQTAAELAEDLTAFLAGNTSAAPTVVGDKLVDRQIAVVPKGLRSFDISDRDFYLQLVPGARDRHGVPQGVRFWEERLGDTGSTQTFRVGMLYGPSGCGKSSLVRAGILPRLPGSVRRILIECTHDQTEARLLAELRRHFPELATTGSLSDALAELREGTFLAPGEKLVLAIDQFEQWLHGWQPEHSTSFVEALRQCDGGRVQAILLVRDDFWMQTTRFFKALDVPLLEGVNAAAVDLFDSSHAKRVLAAFGDAYGRLSSDQARRSVEQERFLDSAVRELAEDGWIVPIRLCIFSEMVKSLPWVPQTLKKVGGAEGIGVTFLEEVFSGRSASPLHRLHRRAARAVLEQLLPPAGSEIRGHLKSESELLIASGYAQSPPEFTDLLRCLDQELRLITPSESGDLNRVSSGGLNEKFYQLTHDFLVDAIRRWLNRDRSRTVIGRAELRLAERSQAYATRQDDRQLPAWWEWVWIAALTQQRRWTHRDRELMRAASRKYALRITGVVGAVLLLIFVAYHQYGTLRAQGLVQALATSDPVGVPASVDQLGSFAWWVKPEVQRRLSEDGVSDEERIRLELGQFSLGQIPSQELAKRLLGASPPVAISIVQVLNKYNGMAVISEVLEAIARDKSQSEPQRLRAIIALASTDGPANDLRWHELAPIAADMAVRDISENPNHYQPWQAGLRFKKQFLLEPLTSMFADRSLTRQGRLLATQLLLDYAANDHQRLLELALGAEPWQCPPLFRALQPYRLAILPTLNNVASIEPTGGAELHEKKQVAARSANAIALLHFLGESHSVWPALTHSSDPIRRSYMLRHFSEVAIPFNWVERLPQLDAGGRQAVILAMGFQANTFEKPEQRHVLQQTLLERFRTDPDAGVHSAAEWSLRRLGMLEPLEKARQELAEHGLQQGFGWYVTKSGIGMVLVRPQGKVWLGSPKHEIGHESDEAPWEVDQNWCYAISATEITQRQYHKLVPEYRDHLNEYASTDDSPVNSVTWLDTAKFCRLLSEAEGIPDEEMVIPPIEKLKKGPYPDILSHVGYRLPTECEWEVACRSGSVTSRFFGDDPELLPLFACYVANFNGTSAPVGSYLPNAWGCFDTLGNVAEWCYNVFQDNPAERSERHISPPGYGPAYRFAVRGNEYFASPRILRVANRREGRSEEFIHSRGFRIAQTVKLP